MADNITAPAAGTVLATDDIAGVHHPLVKLEFGDANSATPVSGTNPLPVTPAPSESYLGKLGADVLTVFAIPTVSTTAYVSGDVIGSKMSFANMVRLAGGAGLLALATLACKSAQTSAVDLLLFGSDPSTTFVDNAPLALAAADYDKLIGVLHITDWTNLGTPSFAQVSANLPFDLAAGTTIYGVLVARASMTLASVNDLKITLAALPG